ncbi:ER lumen protein retaining receptor [Pleurostoma richardsiae]|uniref:ER lumen protein retaining receptor n=1 Tax=Pleurostoma richardsiae TaxID=41990 RepID=A0AA38S762_9PEZI|nr:ER lumen protein retaining receptor [Pleurostoma richardsiae]
MTAFNIFRILGDCSHLLSKLILIFAIHRNRSAEGVSLITQVLYAVVFCSRYTDLFRETYRWNYFFKIFYILSSFYIIGIMRWVYPRTREKELAWKMGAVVFGGSLLLSPFVMLIFERGHYSLFFWLWDFSQILESVCVLPQLLLLRQTTVPTVIDSFYLLTLGSYRGFYLLNWIWRGLDSNDLKPNPVSVIFGVVQTALYLDFAWVYWTRQRVKLRNGGVVDADDIRRGWLLRRIFGKHVVDLEEGEDEESAPALGGGSAGNGTATGRRGAPRAKWGRRGISISADEGVLGHEGEHHDDDDEEHGIISDVEGPVDPDAKMQDPDELAKVLDDEDEDGTLPSAPHVDSPGEPSGVRSGEEWRD